MPALCDSTFKESELKNMAVAHARDHQRRGVDCGVQSDHFRQEVCDELAVLRKDAHCEVEAPDAVLGILSSQEHGEVMFFGATFVHTLHGVVRHFVHLQLCDVEETEDFARLCGRTERGGEPEQPGSVPRRKCGGGCERVSVVIDDVTQLADGSGVVAHKRVGHCTGARSRVAQERCRACPGFSC